MRRCGRGHSGPSRQERPRTNGSAPAKCDGLSNRNDLNSAPDRRFWSFETFSGFLAGELRQGEFGVMDEELDTSMRLGGEEVPHFSPRDSS